VAERFTDRVIDALVRFRMDRVDRVDVDEACCRREYVCRVSVETMSTTEMKRKGEGVHEPFRGRATETIEPVYASVDEEILFPDFAVLAIWSRRRGRRGIWVFGEADFLQCNTKVGIQSVQSMADEHG